MRWRYDRKAIRRLRLERQLAVADLAKQAGVTRQNVALLERGYSEPKATTLGRLATALGVPVTAFYADKDSAA